MKDKWPITSLKMENNRLGKIMANSINDSKNYLEEWGNLIRFLATNSESISGATIGAESKDLFKGIESYMDGLSLKERSEFMSHRYNKDYQEELKKSFERLFGLGHTGVSDADVKVFLFLFC